MATIPRDVLEKMGFAAPWGKRVNFRLRHQYITVAKISIGNNVRIDDFCVLSAGSGGIEIGNYIHIAVYMSLIGAGKITLCDFSGISSRVAIYSSNDDYSGKSYDQSHGAR